MMNILKSLDDELMAGKFSVNINDVERRAFDTDNQPNNEKVEKKIESKDEVGTTTPIKGTNVDLLHLRIYTYCTGTPATTEENEENLVGWHTKFLNRHDLKDMQPCAWLNSMVVDFVAMVNNIDGATIGNSSRWCLTTLFANECVSAFNECKKPQNNCLQQRSRQFDLPTDWDGELIFVPICHQSHWWCLALHKPSMKFYVLDSMESLHRGEKGALDKYLAFRVLENLHLSNPDFPVPVFGKIKFERITLPRQHNVDDCGIFTIKYMELWDPQVTYDSQLTMPTWTEPEVKKFRVDIVCGWVLDDRNEFKHEMLRNANITHLSTSPQPHPIIHSTDNDCHEADPTITCSATKLMDDFISTIPPSSIATRVKGQGRNRVKGPLTRTPFTPLRQKGGKRKKQQKVDL